MRSAAKRHRRKTQREAARERRQQDPVIATDEDLEVAFPHIDPAMESPIISPDPAMESQMHSPPASPISQGELDYTVALTMVQKLNAQLGDMHMDNEKIESICDGLLRDYRLRDEAIDNLTQLVKKAVDCPATQRPHQDTAVPYVMVPPDLIDADENLGITWQGSETFLHGVRVVGPRTAGSQSRHQPTTSMP